MTAPVPHAREWSLTLYVSGAAPRSAAAIETVRRICDEDFDGDVHLAIVDVHERCTPGVPEDVVAAPTLVRWRPGPPRRVVGDLSDAARVRRELGLDAR